MKKLLLAALAVAGLATACRKDDDVVTCPPPVPASLDGLTKRHAPRVQVFEFDPTRDQTIRTAGGARLEIWADAFVRADGAAPTGPVKLLFQEIYAPAIMLLADMPTTDWQGQPLESGGEFNIRVYEANARLRLRHRRRNRVDTIAEGLRMLSPVPARVGADTRDSMQVWSLPGVSDSARGWQPVRIPRTTNTSIPLTLAPPSPDSVGAPGQPWQPVGPPMYKNGMWPDTLGWLNYDVYLPGLTRVNVHVATGQLWGDQRVYLIPADRNGAFRLYPNARTNQFDYHFLPQGLDLTAVVLQVKDGKYYFGTHRAPAAEGFVYRPVLEEVNEEELVRRIRLL